MATRNINVVISANVRRYTDGLRRAQTETRKFQQTVSTTSRSIASSGQASSKAAAQQNAYGKALHGMARGGGRAMAMQNHYSAAIHRGNRAMAEAQKQTGAWAKGMGFLKSAAVQSVAALGGFALLHTVINGVRKAFSFVVDSVLQFDTAITESLAIASEYGPGVRKQFEEAARAQSKLSAFSPAELAEGYYQLLSAGLDTNAAIQATAVVANFAQAGVMDLEQASELAAQATSALGLANGETADTVLGMTRVTDSFVRAAIDSTATVEEFAEAMTNKFGTSVSLANRSVEEATTVLMAYARVGVKGRLAGTQASMFMRDIQKAAINNKQAMKDLGIEVFDTNGEMNNLVTIGKQLNSAFGDMSSENLRIMLKQLGFADRAVHAILPLVATGAETWDKYYASQKDASGTSAKIAARQLESITNQMKLMQQGLSTLAEKGGRAALRALYSGWERIKDPVQDVWENVQKIGKNIVDGLKPAATILGGALFGALQGTLQVLKGITNALVFLGPVTQPLITLATTALLLSKGWSLVGTAMVSMTGKMATLVAGNAAVTASNAAATASTTASGAAALFAGTAYERMAVQEVASANAGTLAVVGGNLKKIVSFAALKTAAAAAWTSVNAFAAANAPLILAAAIAGIAFSIKRVKDSWRDMGTEMAQGTAEQFNMDNFEERQQAVEAQIKQVEQVREAYEKGAGDSKEGGIWGWMQDRANQRAMQDGTNAAIAEAQRLDAENKKLEKGIQSIAETSGVSFSVAAKRVEASGMTEALINNAEGSKEYEAAIDGTNESLANVADIMISTGMSASEMSNMSDEAMQEMQDDSSELQKKFSEVFATLFDPSEVMSKIQEVNEAISAGFGGTLGSVYTDLQTELSDAAQEASDNAFDSYSEGIDAQIEALQDKKDDLDPPSGKKVSNARKDQIDQEKEAIDDQIDALRDGKKAKEDFAAADPVPTMAQYLEKLRQTSEKSNEFSRNLQTLREKLRGQVPPDMVDSIVTQFAEMGEEGAPLVDEFAKATGQKFIDMAASVQASIAAMNPEVKTTLQDLIAAQTEGMAKIKNMSESLITFNAQMMFDEGLSVDQIKGFAALGPEYAAMIPEMVAQINAAGPPGSAAAQAKALEIANVVKTQLQLADYGAGAIPDAIAQAMVETRDAMGWRAGEVTEAMKNKLLDSEETLRGAMSFLGSSATDAWWDSLIAGLEAKGDPWATGIAQSARTPGKIVANEAGWFINGEEIKGEMGKANGGIVQFANGGMWNLGGKPEDHKPQIAKAGQMRLWAEPETGGEAYIPLGQNKRSSALPVLAEVARRFGYAMTQYADGGIMAPGAPMVGGGNWGTPQSSVQVVPVPVPIESRTVTNFNGPIQGVKMEDAEAYAARKRRQQRLAGGRR